jgi:hypothetical protein
MDMGSRDLREELSGWKAQRRTANRREDCQQNKAHEKAPVLNNAKNIEYMSMSSLFI